MTSIQCYVPGCESNKSIDTKLKFFPFPKSDHAANTWFDEIKIATGHQNALKPVTLSDRICEKHFKAEDFFFTHGLKALKANSVPSIFDVAAPSPEPQPSSRLKACRDKLTQKMMRNVELAQAIKRKEAELKALEPEIVPTKLKCRICFKRAGSISIFGYLPRTSISIMKAIRETFNLCIKNPSHFPEKLCQRCFGCLENAHILKLELLETEAKLHELDYEAQKLGELPMKRVKKSKEDPSVTILKASEENAVFIINELPDSGEIKCEQELTIEGDQAAFTETLSDDEIKKEPEDSIEGPSTSNLVIKTVQSLTSTKRNLLQEALEKKKMLPTISDLKLPKLKCSGRFVEPKIIPSGSFDLDVNGMLKEAIKNEQKILPSKSFEEWSKEEKAAVKREKFARFECLKCKHLAITQYDLIKHVDSSEQGCIELYDTKMDCSLCQRKFIYKNSLIEHLTRDHIKDAPADGKCTQCNKLSAHFKNPIFYERHFRSHVSEPKIICPECGKKFYSSKNYCSHAAIHRKQTYYCDHCNYKGKAKGLISRHLRKHNNSLNVVCEICSKSVTCDQTLQEHKFRIHKIAEDGAFYCKSCDYCFFYRHDFAKHITQCNGPEGKKFPPLCVRVPRKDFDADIEIKAL